MSWFDDMLKVEILKKKKKIIDIKLPKNNEDIRKVETLSKKKKI